MPSIKPAIRFSYPAQCVRRLGGFSRWLFLSFSISVFSGCATDGQKPSLEQAKQISLNFKESALFVPPPRDSSDIFLLLDKADANVERCSRPLPPNLEVLKPLQRANFLGNRGRELYRIGCTVEALNLLRKAQRLAKSEAPDSHIYFKITNTLIRVEMRSGRQDGAVKMARSGIEQIKRTIRYKGFLMQYAGHLVEQYASVGDMENAQIYYAEAEAQYHIEMEKNWENRHHWEAALEVAQGAMADARGALKDGERHYRSSAKKLIEHRVKNKGDGMGVSATDSMHYRLLTEYLVDNLLAQGRLAEAEVEARKGLELILERLGRYNSDSANALLAIARVFMAQGRFTEASKIAEAGVEIFSRTGATKASHGYGRVLSTLASARLHDNNLQGALDAFEMLKSSLVSVPDVLEARVNANLDWAMTLLASNQAGAAAKVIEKALERRITFMGEGHYSVAEALGFKAVAMVMGNRPIEARRLFDQAFPRLSANQGKQQSKADQRRLQFIVNAYLKLLTQGAPNAEDVDKAFQVYQLVGAWETQGELASSAARSAIPDPELAKLIRSEQNLKKQITATVRQLGFQSTKRGGSGKLIFKHQQRIKTLSDARTAILDEVKNRFPEYDQLINPRPISLASVQQTLRNGEAFVTIYPGRDSTYVWAVGVEGQPFFAIVPMGRREMAGKVKALRGAIDTTVVDEILGFDMKLAHELYSKLLAPVSRSWEKADTLLAVVHGSLGSLPLVLFVKEPTAQPEESGLLFSRYKKVPWLGRTHAVAYLPSPSAFVNLRKLPPPRADRLPFIGFGDPIFGNAETDAGANATVALRGGSSFNVRGLRVTKKEGSELTEVASADLSLLARLPDTSEEVRDVAKSLGVEPGGNVFLRGDANERRLKNMSLNNRRVVHFATHGLLPGDLDGLEQPALALSSPAHAGGHGDGLLTLGEILALELDADWVVLSACNTGVGDDSGFKAVSGLGQAFFYAGARSLLVTHWPVESVSARLITTNLFQHAANSNLSRAQALHRTINDLMDRDSADGSFSYAHPIFWAPFTLNGDVGGVAAR